MHQQRQLVTWMDLKMGVTIVQLTVGSVTSRQRYQASSELQQQQDQLHVIHNTDAGMYLHPLLYQLPWACRQRCHGLSLWLQDGRLQSVQQVGAQAVLLLTLMLCLLPGA